MAAALAAFAAAVIPGVPARAFPPAGSDTLPVNGTVSIRSRLGQETVALSGTATVQRSAQYLSGGVDIVDIEITSMALTGMSVTGPVTVIESPSLASPGKIQALQAQPVDYPASSYFDTFVRVTAPASPNPTITLYNTAALHAAGQSLTEWPPHEMVYSASPFPCLPLLPYDPMRACIVSASFTLGGPPAVGGVTELPRVSPLQSGNGRGANAGVTAGVVVAALTMLFIISVFAWRRRAQT